MAADGRLEFVKTQMPRIGHRARFPLAEGAA